ncbi:MULTISPECIES: hypothetical protein [unclassified Streptomyces]|uniref:hypothetical protein n=1 Tax=unclassified Streptomyces TaxID=2593676 RepID=UPI0033BA5146
MRANARGALGVAAAGGPVPRTALPHGPAQRGPDRRAGGTIAVRVRTISACAFCGGSYDPYCGRPSSA